jgi:hypothetical protein
MPTLETEALREKLLSIGKNLWHGNEDEGVPTVSESQPEQNRS